MAARRIAPPAVDGGPTRPSARCGAWCAAAWSCRSPASAWSQVRERLPAPPGRRAGRWRATWRRRRRSSPHGLEVSRGRPRARWRRTRQARRRPPGVALMPARFQLDHGRVRAAARPPSRWPATRCEGRRDRALQRTPLRRSVVPTIDLLPAFAARRRTAQFFSRHRAPDAAGHEVVAAASSGFIWREHLGIWCADA